MENLSSSEEGLDIYRKKIDKIDKEIMDMLAIRARYVLKIADIKAKNNQQIYVPSREQELIQRLCSINTGHFSDSAVNNIFSAITKECRKIQANKFNALNIKNNKINIAIQGIVGSFSDKVAKDYCNEKAIANVEYIYAVSSRAVINNIMENKASIGVVAVFNNWGGIVDETVEALKDIDYEIIDTYKLMVKQNILVLNNTRLEDITDVYSHDQAISQCRKFLSKELPKACVHAVEDTAKAAMNLAQGIYHQKSAVIGSKESAKFYGLNTLAKDIQDKDCNETMFLIIKNKDD